MAQGKSRFIAFLAFSIIITGLVFYFTLPDVSVLSDHYPHISYLESEGKTLVDFRPDRPATWIPLPQITRGAVGAVIVSEDYAFYHHHGIDWSEVFIVLR